MAPDVEIFNALLSLINPEIPQYKKAIENKDRKILNIQGLELI